MDRKDVLESIANMNGAKFSAFEEYLKKMPGAASPSDSSGVSRPDTVSVKRDSVPAADTNSAAKPVKQEPAKSEKKKQEEKKTIESETIAPPF